MLKKTLLFIVLILSLFILISSSIVFAEKPTDIKLDYFVNDYANILTQEEEDIIGTELTNLFDSGIAQFSVVTVNSLDGQDITSFAYQVAEGKLGDKDKNNGLLLLISVQDRKYRFEVGRGLEPYLNDAKIGRIGREFLVPNFKNGDYFTGIDESVLSIKSILENDINSTYYVDDKENSPSFSKTFIIIIVLFFILMFIAGIIDTIHKIDGNKKPNSKRNHDDVFSAAVIAASLLKGGGKGGFGGGGFGGFGGGSFGGGGAGSGW